MSVALGIIGGDRGSEYIDGMKPLHLQRRAVRGVCPGALAVEVRRAVVIRGS